MFYFPINIGFMSSFQLTNSYVSEGWPWPTNQTKDGLEFTPQAVNSAAGYEPFGYGCSLRGIMMYHRNNLTGTDVAALQNCNLC